MKKWTWIALLWLMSPCINAEAYLDLGLMASVKTGYQIKTGRVTTDCHVEEQVFVICDRQAEYREPKNPYGLVEIGYNVDDFSFFFMHISSIPDNDGGINMVGLKRRFTLYE